MDSSDEEYKEPMSDEKKLAYMREYYVKNKQDQNRKRALYYYREKYGLPLSLVPQWKSKCTKHRQLLKLLDEVDVEILAWAILNRKAEALQHMKDSEHIPTLARLVGVLEEQQSSAQ